MTTPIVMCGFCKHLELNKEKTCKAFPKGIPTVIILGEHDHTKPYEGDNGIRFEPIEEEE